MAKHEFGIMQTAPQKGKRYDAYDPQKYNCITVDDDYLEDIVTNFDDIDFSENVFVKDCDGFLNYINNIKPDIIDMHGGNTYNNLVKAAVEME